MPAGITIKVDMKRARRFLSDVQKKQIPFATALAITNTLHIARKDVVKQLEKDIDRPVPWTKRGFRVIGAKKTLLTGKLFVLPSQNEYLFYQIEGGVRRPKGQALALPPAKHASGDVRRNKYGNIPRTQQARAQISKGAISANIGGVAGIWKVPKKTKTGKVRKGQKLKLLLAYEKQAVYRPRFRFYERGKNSIRVNWPREFDKAFARAMRTAR